jgi:hypothetical protein
MSSSKDRTSSLKALGIQSMNTVMLAVANEWTPVLGLAARPTRGTGGWLSVATARTVPEKDEVKKALTSQDSRMRMARF